MKFAESQQWTVIFHPECDQGFSVLDKEVQKKLLARTLLIKQFGPKLSRPYADILNNSLHRNMKELRFDSKDGVWRVAFAFDKIRQAILLAAGDKTGVNENLFYKRLIEIADFRFANHLAINLRLKN